MTSQPAPAQPSGAPVDPEDTCPRCDREWKKHADCGEYTAPQPSGALREVLDQAINVLYGLRNFARHNDNCVFAQTITGVEAENQPCSCRFDEVLTAFDEVLEQARAALAAAQPAKGLREALAIDGRTVHTAWRDGMLHQGRPVSEQRMSWESLSVEDRQLDDWIAFHLIAALAAVQPAEELSVEVLAQMDRFYAQEREATVQPAEGLDVEVLAQALVHLHRNGVLGTTYGFEDVEVRAKREASLLVAECARLREKPSSGGEG